MKRRDLAALAAGSAASLPVLRAELLRGHRRSGRAEHRPGVRASRRGDDGVAVGDRRQGPGRGRRPLPALASRLPGRRAAVARLRRAAAGANGTVAGAGYGTQITALQQAATDRGGRFGALPLEVRRAHSRRGVQGGRRPEPAATPRRQARGRRPDGALLPQQRRQRSLLQRAHRPAHVSRHSRDDGAAAAADWQGRSL